MKYAPHLELSHKNSPQWQFFESQQFYSLFHGGLGSGKSFILCHKILRLAVENPGVRGLVVSAKNKLLISHFIPMFRNLVGSCGMSHIYRASEKLLTLPNGSEILFQTAKEPILSWNCGWAAVDEGCFIEDERFGEIIGRLRVRCPHPQLVVVSSPNGKSGWVFDNFIKEPLENSFCVKGSSRDNKWNRTDFVSDMERAMDGKHIQCQIDGDFVDFSHDQIYSSFTDKNIAEIWPIPMTYGSMDAMKLTESIILTCDFGRRIGAWIVCQQFTINKKTYLAVIDEIHQENTDTMSMAEAFLSRYQGKTAVVEVRGEAMGHFIGGSTATKTDYDIINQTMGNIFKLSIMSRKRNPHHIDRINVFNMALKGNNDFQMRIHPRCEHLIEDINTCRYMGDGSRRFDKHQAGGIYTHHTDALGYLLYDLDTPLRNFTRNYSR